MSDIYGTGVGRHLNGKDRQYSSVIMQVGKPPIAEEFNLLTDVMEEARKDLLRANIPSGWVMNVYDPKSDYEFNTQASNMFWLGRSAVESVNNLPTAIVNGWTIPVAGTLSSDLRNAIKLPPPQASTSSTDVNFVFLEVWKAQVSPDGTVNKPSSDKIYRFGNVEFGGTNLTNQILDPRYNKETSERHQLQYRIRVVSAVNPAAYPYGFNPAIRGQGPLDAQVTSANTAYQYQNMGEELGDPGLWRAGIANTVSEDGTNILTQSALSTVDGYVYAIPMCMVFRRSSESWTVSQQAGAYNRAPDVTDRSQASVLPTVELTSAIGPDDLTINVSVSRTSTTFPETSGQIQIGREVIQYASWVGTVITVSSTGRGSKDTFASTHAIGDTVEHVTGHPLNLFSDQIVEADVLDLRHAINLSGLDFDGLLQQNFSKLITGKLRTQWKVSSGDVKGTRHFQADYFSQQAPPANYAIERDGPDGFRRIFSDACALQPNNLLVVPQDGNTVTSSNYSFNPSSAVVYRTNTLPATWEEGDNVRINLSPLKNTFKTADDQKVRFVHPREYEGSSHAPVSVTFGDRTTDRYTDAGINSGSDRELIVLGKIPEDVSTLFHTGLTSDITFDTDTVDIVTSGAAVVDFSTAAPGGGTLADYLAGLDAYIVIEDSAFALPYKGAFKIIGSDGGTGLQVQDATGVAAAFGASATRTCDWRIRLEVCTEDDTEMIIVLGPQAFFQKALYLNFDVLYHPNQGLARVPEVPLFTQLEPGGSTAYVRENTFPNKASSVVQTVKKYPNTPMESYPVDRANPRFRGNDARTSIEDTWAESYVDKGSKTLLFQPIREADLYINADVIVDAQDNVTSYASPGQSTGLDFELGDGDPCIFVPSEVLPPAGRIDLPLIRGTGGNVPSGLNFVFPVLEAGTRVNENITQNRILGVYDPNNTTLPGDYNTYVSLATIGSGGPAENALVCRLYDRGGVRGIELPPHFGVARLFGIYIRSDYYTNGSEYTVGSSYRVKKSVYAGTNLLRLDVTRRSLIITEDDTFVIPEDVLDLETLGSDISTAEIVFEFGGFMFNDWKADRVQIHTVNGTATSDGVVPVLINGPAAQVDTFYNVSTRVPYQGNVNGTMPVSTNDTASLSFADYTVKSQADRDSALQNLATPLDARDARVVNPAKLEVLASLPFLTSVGTGRISGAFAEGSYTDVGYVSQSGFPFSLPAEVRSARVRALEGESPTQLPVSDVLSGMSERLPAGILASDHLLLGEGFYGEQTRFKTHVPVTDEGMFGDYQNNVALSKPLAEGVLLFSDGTSGGNSATVSYSGTPDLYRTYRGGVVTAASGPNPGGSVLLGTDRMYKDYPFLRDFGTEYARLNELNRQGTITATELTIQTNALIDKYRKRYQIHGAATFGVALLVQTRQEKVTDNELVFNNGGEIQMLILTGTAFGVDAYLEPLSGSTVQTREFIQPVIQLQVAGIGEGYAAADRYRIQGRPLRLESRSPSDIGFEIFRGALPAEDTDPICP